METRKRTPLELFNLPQHFVIPLFQRPYVWEEENQWAPLWRDILRTIDMMKKSPHLQTSHFLGAVVLQAAEPAPGSLAMWNVIDGQQRLTTLQLLMDATHAILVSNGFERLASKLEGLTNNLPHFVPEGESHLKLRHLNNDRSAFDEVMNAEAPVEYDDLEYVDSRIARAHRYFSNIVNAWLGEPGTEGFSTNAEYLTEVLQGGLQLVSIDLTPDEDSQEIFETLNARGTPLTTSDLVRNFVFQRLEAEGADSKLAYEKDWPFETAFWKKEVSVGRQYISRSSLFINQWLASQLGEEISPPTTFNRFKTYVDHDAQTTVTALLPKLKQQADLYQSWTEVAFRSDGNLSPIEMAVYRMQASGIELLKPILIWLSDPELKTPQNVVGGVILATESWVYRRQLLRLSNSDLGRNVADIIRIFSNTPHDQLVAQVTAYLSRLDVTSNYWPGDDEVLKTLKNEPVFRRYPRRRLRMFLEKIEDTFRSKTNQPQVQRWKLPIEHILPQNWQEHWTVNTPEEEENRSAHVHHLGNLTLLTSSLNSKLSNGPWSNKRQELQHHNTIILTGRLLVLTENESWNESLIEQRSETLLKTLLQAWPVPDGHTGQVKDPQPASLGEIDLKKLIEVGLLSAGQTLVPQRKEFSGDTGKLLADGNIEIKSRKYLTPSAAAKSVTKKGLNGWHFWGLSDGRRLLDVRSEYRAKPTSS